jgi:hypothetical protein
MAFRGPPSARDAIASAQLRGVRRLEGCGPPAASAGGKQFAADDFLRVARKVTTPLEAVSSCKW